MAKPKKKKAKEVNATQARTIVENRKARFKYEVLKQIECGIILFGSEIKSLRNNKISIDEAYGRIQKGELFLVGCDIAEYFQASIWNHASKRTRKLLVHKKEFDKLSQQALEKGLSLIPLRVLLNERGIAKVVLGICKGKKMHDKRESLKKQDMKRQIDRAMRAAGR